MLPFPADVEMCSQQTHQISPGKPYALFLSDPRRDENLQRPLIAGHPKANLVAHLSSICLWLSGGLCAAACPPTDCFAAKNLVPQEPVPRPVHAQRWPVRL